MSLIVSPSKLAREAVEAALADPIKGFNANYAAAMTNHPGAPAMSIDFTNPKSRNFFRGDVDPESIEEAGIFSYPLMTLFSTIGTSSNLQKFQRYAGLVQIGGRVLLSDSIYKSARLLHDFEAWPDCVEDAYLQVIQEPTAALWPASAAYSIVYNGDISFDRKFPLQAGTSWLQLISFKMTFEMVIA